MSFDEKLQLSDTVTIDMRDSAPYMDTRRQAHVHLHEGVRIGIWAVYRRHKRREERIGTYCPICGFIGSPEATQSLRTEALASIAEAKRLKLRPAKPPTHPQPTATEYFKP